MSRPESAFGRLRESIGRAILGRDAQVFYTVDSRSAQPLDAQPSYSQEGEDRVLVRLLGGKSDGFYVDIGAHHPTRFSNTALLYESGWHGINVDPIPGSKQEFQRIRTRDVNLEVGVGRETGTLPYFVFDEPALGTFSRDRALDLESTTDYRLVRTVNVPVMRLAELLDQYLPADQAIDLLMVDAEGLDLEVLQSNDWNRFRPEILIAEDLGLLPLGQLHRSPVVRFLGDNGYEPIAKTMNSVFFKPKATQG